MTQGSAILPELRDAELRIVGRFADASNLTLLSETPQGLRCVYKPTEGERPLWDFAVGTLANREVAMYLLAQAIGWDVVPQTVLRADGPYGRGSCQRFIEQAGPPAVRLQSAAEVAAHWRVIGYGQDDAGAEVALAHTDSAALRRIALLDVIANNADRKGGHLLTDAAGRIWGIDHGLTFHHQDKLRSVLWGFAGEPIAPQGLADLGRAADSWDSVAQVLADHLVPAELAAARARLLALVRAQTYPRPTPGWPRLPWPPM